MNARGKARYTSTVHRLDKKYYKKICFNKKSFASMFLSAALLLTSIDCMHVRAEEMADQVLPAMTEETPKLENQDTASGNTLAQEKGTAGQNFVKTETGAVIITSFVPLNAEKSRFLLDKAKGRLSLEEVTKLLPTELRANATIYVSEDPGTEGGKLPETETGDNQQPAEGEQPGTETGDGQQPAEGEQPGTETGDGQQSTEGEQPGTETGDGQQPTDGERPGSDAGDGQQPTGGEQLETETGGGQQPTEGEQPGTETEDGQQPAEGEQPEIGTEDDQPFTEEAQSATGQERSEAVESQSVTGGEESATNDVAVAESDRTFAAEGGHQWRLLVAAEVGVDEADESENNEAKVNESASGGDDIGGGENNGNTDDNANDGSKGDGTNGGDHADDGENSGDAGENGSPDSNTSNGETGGTDGSGSADGSISDGEPGAGKDEPVLSTKEVDVEIPVQWVCEDDYENTELTEYTFRPTWDKTAWFYEADETADSVPVITVSYVEVIKEEVSTQEELAAAFAAGVNKITLTADITLTATLSLPASADIELDGQGHSLLRGKDENGLFIGTMINMDGHDYTEETYGTLTLKDITVDGKTSADRAGAPVILDCGSLILEKDAVVRDNYNYGTYPSDEEQDAETIHDYGGIQVYGELSVTEESLVTGNFADEFGGGVYLADGAMLYFYADVIRENSVSEDAGYGADLYAASGSTIYYDSSIDMERDGFYLCEGVILICMQGQDAVRAGDESYRHDDKVEIFISAAKESGFDDKFLEALTKELESDKYGYSVIPKRAQIDTSDLRNWYVYDHYDTAAACWGDESETDSAGNTVPKQWRSTYGDNPRRKYYPCTENNYRTATGSGTLVYTIADWLDNVEYQFGGGYSLAQFKEHIYSRSTDMTFVGYGNPCYVDFMYYDPQSNGEKVVEFDINSSKVISHALSGMGFLVNAGVKGGLLYGYLIYYHYNEELMIPGDNPTNLYICKLNGIDVEAFHDGTLWDDGSERDLKFLFSSDTSGEIRAENRAELRKLGIEIKKSVQILSESIPTWDSQMSIRIQVSPTKIEIWQQPGNVVDAVTDSDETGPVSLVVEDSGYSGFGPLMAYASYAHSCERASCFTYSNVHMYYTNPTQGNQDMLQPLELADYTQEGTQKYFLNLFGASDQGYNMEGVETGLYQEYLKLMQVEGVALITDRETPFKDYLGESGEAGSNLCEIGMRGGSTLTVEALAAKIAEYIEKQTTTYIQHKLQSNGSGELKDADPKQAVGNIWLESATGNEQIREPLQGNSFSRDGYKIQIRDDIAYYYEDRSKYTVTYDIIKPNGSKHTFTVKASDSTVPSFVVGTDSSEWSAGRYTVKQTIIGAYGESTVHGYAYFDVERPVDGDHTHTHTWSKYTITQEAGCTTEGRKTRSCLTCGKMEEEIIPAKGHSISKEWGADAAGHWHECERCNEKFDHDSHTWGEYTIEQEADCTTEGRKRRSCLICEWTEEETIPAKGHSIKEEWSTNSLEHWHECEICNKKFDIDFHQFGAWITDEEATEIKDGSKYRVCTDCGYKERDSIVRGKITKREDCGENAPQTEISTELSALALAVLAEEDVHAVGNGTDITIVLTVEDADNTVSAADKEAVTSTVKSYKLGQYFDMNLFKEMNGGKFRVAETSDEIRLSIEVPGKFRKTARKYAIVRVHNGEAVLLKDLDAEDDTVTIDTDRFSTYAFVYADRTKAGESSSKLGSFEEKSYSEQAESEYIVAINYQNQKEALPESQKDSEPRTGETTRFELYATIAFINGASYLYFLFGGRRGMTEETKTELVSRLIRWAKHGGKFRRWLALAVIFLLLVYYHSIGKQVGMKWRQVCGE